MNVTVTIVAVAILALIVLGLAFAWVTARTGGRGSMSSELRRPWEAGRRPATFVSGRMRKGAVTTDDQARAQDEARSYGIRFIIGSLFADAILARALIAIPGSADPAIPAMLGGGMIGLLLAWLFPIWPTGSTSRHEPAGLSSYSPTTFEKVQRGREMMRRYRNPVVYVLAELPYFVILLAVYVSPPVALMAKQTAPSLEWLLIFAVLGAIGTFQTGWGVQILQVWRSMRGKSAGVS